MDMKETKCELCGTPVKIVGKTTLHYEPIVLSVEELEAILRNNISSYNPNNPHETTRIKGISKSATAIFNRMKEGKE